MEHLECLIRVVIIMCVLLNGLGWSHACVKQEREALLQLKHSFIRLNWPDSSNSLDCCEWERVVCDATTGRITKLFLDHRTSWDTYQWWSLNTDQWWSLNTSYFLPFEQLTSLDLSDNRLAGFVENRGFETLSLRLTKLEELYLGENYFNDSIISSLNGFSSLRSLDLSYNEMGTTLDANGLESLWQLSNLEFLDLSGNKFNNSMMSSLHGLSLLKNLNLGANELSGTIDLKVINSMVHLKRLDMSGNDNITGFGSFKGDLEVLDLSGNCLNNNVFAFLNGLSHLRSLNLSNNQLTGSINLQELSGLRNLEDLQLNANSIEEIVGPEDKTTLNKLKVLGLNKLWVLGLNHMNPNAKVIALKSLGALSALKTIDLQGNIMNETNTFQDLLNLRAIEELFLADSSLHKDFLRSHVGSFTSLKVLLLSNCGLKGTLPDRGWCDLKKLEKLDLGSNELEGALPPCMANLSSLRFLSLARNQFTGNIASGPILNLKYIEILSLQYNHFEVSLKAFANHSSLKVFVARDGNQLIDEAASQPWTPKFQVEVLSLSNCISKNSNASFLNSLYHQFSLIYLDLSDSKFGGAFPSWLFENNTRLEWVHLRNNSFVGPFQLPSHPNLNMSVIDISHNKIEGLILSNISSIFPNLVALNISRNSLLGTIPPSFGDLKSLYNLDFSDNQFSGEIKEQFTNTPLKVIKLSNNNFSGSIPKYFFDHELSQLFLDGNNFVGEIPDLSSLKRLGILDISRNSLSGKLPSWIANMSGLEEIDMSNNHFGGSVLLEFCKLHYLRFLALSRNDLSGSIPPCFSELKNLEHVLLGRNKLRGPIPHAFRNCTGLRILDLGDNNFSGTIPNWISNFSRLAVLLLQENNFHGNIPIELCHLKQLHIVTLSSNKLSGCLHACLSNFSSVAPDSVSYQELLRSFYASSIPYINELGYYGVRPSNFTSREVLEFRTKSNSFNYTGYILNHMYGIDISCNKFSGEIPIEFGNLSNIRSLNLSHNNLIGLIPTTFSNLKQLESLDLSYNNLNGPIPPQLIEVTSLAVFIVAHNNLSGPIPTKNQFGTFNESSYEGNPLLCGPSLNKSCDETHDASPPTYSLIEQSEDESFMEMIDFWVSFVVAYTIILLSMVIVLCINPYWRQVWLYHIEVCINNCYYFVVDEF